MGFSLGSNPTSSIVRALGAGAPGVRAQPQAGGHGLDGSALQGLGTGPGMAVVTIMMGTAVPLRCERAHRGPSWA